MTTNSNIFCMHYDNVISIILYMFFCCSSLLVEMIPTKKLIQHHYISSIVKLFIILKVFEIYCNWSFLKIWCFKTAFFLHVILRKLKQHKWVKSVLKHIFECICFWESPHEITKYDRAATTNGTYFLVIQRLWVPTQSDLEQCGHSRERNSTWGTHN